MLTSFFSGMPPMLQAFWVIALIATALFLVLTVLSFLGADFDVNADVDLDASTDVSGLISPRTVVNFLLGYGWAGVVFFHRVESAFWLQVFAVASGLLFAACFLLILTLFLRLAQDGTFRLSQAVGHSAEVYLPIAGARASAGKVQFSAGGSVHEADALTDGDALPTGTKVRILSLIDDSTLLVERV